jgi:hypothetical protein
MKRTGTCGTATVNYDDKVCAFQCQISLIDNVKAQWSMACPDGKGGWTITTGTGRVTEPPPKHDVVTVAGNLQAIAENLQRLWKRPVMIRIDDERKTVHEQTLTGSPEEMAEALGLELAKEKKEKKEKKARS